MRPHASIALLFLALLTLASCNKSFEYQIQGTLDNLPEVKELYLISDMATGTPFDTIKVKDSKFDYAGKADSVTFCFLGNLNDSITLIPIFLEEGTIKIVVSSDPKKLKVSGTQLNDKLQKLNEAGFKYQDEIQSILSTVNDSTSEEEKASLEAKAMESMKTLATIYYQTAEKNIDNELGYFLVTNPAFLHEDQVMTLISKMPASMRKRPLIKDIEAAGFHNVIIKQNRQIQINKEAVNCDLYDLFSGDTSALKSYHGEYMIDYSWAEISDSAERIKSL